MGQGGERQKTQEKTVVLVGLSRTIYVYLRLFGVYLRLSPRFRHLGAIIGGMNRILAIFIFIFIFCSPTFAATYYTSHDAPGSGIGTIGDPFTLQEGLDASTSADLLLVMDTGPYTPSATLDVNTNAGSDNQPTRIRGANSDGSDDGTVATISGSSLPATTDLFTMVVANQHFSNLRITAATQHNVYQGATGLTFENCRIDNAAGDGVLINGFAQTSNFFDCEIDNNANGVNGAFTSRGDSTYVHCVIRDNTTLGVQWGGANHRPIVECLFYGNGGDAVQAQSGSSGSMEMLITRSTFFNNGGDAIQLSATTRMIAITNCIITDSGGYGINGGSADQFSRIDNNNFYNNTSGAWSVGTLPGVNTALDPDYVNEGSGTENLSPQNTSLLTAQAFPSGGTTYQYPGAIQPQAGAGGGDKWPYPDMDGEQQ